MVGVRRAAMAEDLAIMMMEEDPRLAEAAANILFVGRMNVDCRPDDFNWMTTTTTTTTTAKMIAPVIWEGSLQRTSSCLDRRRRQAASAAAA